MVQTDYEKQIVAPDHEIEREATLNRYIRQLKPFTRLTMSSGYISRLFLNIIE